MKFVYPSALTSGRHQLFKQICMVTAQMHWSGKTCTSQDFGDADREAAQLFVGKHDFTHFANVSEANQNPVKTITRFDVIVDDDGYVFQVEGHGFLYKMVCLHFALLAHSVSTHVRL